jgi:phage terminase Nu1 subunit (DNA packaging protein)
MASLASPTPHCTPATLARLFHLTERRVQQLAKDGIIPKGDHGQYDLIQSVQGYIKFLQERIVGRGDGEYAESPDIKYERKRLIKAQADKTEMEYQTLCGEWLACSFVENLLTEAAQCFAAEVDALPARLAPLLAGMHDAARIKATLFDACRQVRMATAKQLRQCAGKENDSDSHSDSDRERETTASVSGEPRGCPLDTDTGSMGGSEPAIATGECGARPMAE